MRLIQPGFALTLIQFCLFCGLVDVAFAQTNPESRAIEPFQITLLDGEVREITRSDSRQLTIVAFLGTECPLARLYGPRLESIENEFAGEGVTMIGVFPNVQDSLDDVRTYRREHQISFPCGRDNKNQLTVLFGARRTPEVFVLDQQLEIRYHGRIDDQYLPGIARPQADRRDLAIAVRELLDGEAVSVPVTDVVGCLIGRRRELNTEGSPSAGIRYTRQISRILQSHCVECHREGEIGPFVLDDYDEVVGWADMMLEVIDEGRMPPWHADPTVNTFRNERKMPEDDKAMLRQWVADGMPFGDASELPPPVVYTTGWRLPREPDAIFEMTRPFRVPADGTVEYQYFVVDTGFTEDRWVTAAEVIPGNRRVVHHSIVFIRPPDGADFRGVGWLAAYVPGQSPPGYEPHRGRRVPAGSKLVFQQHYTPIGRSQSDATRIGLIFGDEQDITEELYTLIAIEQFFEIPPHSSDFAVTAELPWLPPNGRVLAVSPHMHWRGKAFELSGRQQDRSLPLVRVPRYDFNWQHSYQFREPIALADFEGLDVRMTFDNSAANPVNPDPTQPVTWGDQTWEEMAVAFFEIAEPLNAESHSIPAETVDPKLAAERERKILVFVEGFFDRFDENKDAVVHRNEVPQAVKHFRFWEFDTNGDNLLDRAEVREAIGKRVK